MLYRKKKKPRVCANSVCGQEKKMGTVICGLPFRWQNCELSYVPHPKLVPSAAQPSPLIPEGFRPVPMASVQISFALPLLRLCQPSTSRSLSSTPHLPVVHRRSVAAPTHPPACALAGRTPVSAGRGAHSGEMWAELSLTVR